jgi:hypothetical protein
MLTFVCLIIAQILGWIYATNTNTGFFSVIPTMYQGHVFSPFTINVRIAGFLVSAVPLVFQLLVLSFLIKLFGLYANHKFFTADNVRYIRNAGYALLLQQLAIPLADFVMGFVLTSTNPPGLHYASMQITEKNVGVIFIALIIILISWIMAEGCKLQSEQELII